VGEGCCPVCGVTPLCMPSPAGGRLGRVGHWGRGSGGATTGTRPPLPPLIPHTVVCCGHTLATTGRPNPLLGGGSAINRWPSTAWGRLALAGLLWWASVVVCVCARRCLGHVRAMGAGPSPNSHHLCVNGQVAGHTNKASNSSNWGGPH